MLRPFFGLSGSSRPVARHHRTVSAQVTATVVDQMGEAYHELRPAAGTVAEATRGEEEAVYRHTGPGTADPDRHAVEGACVRADTCLPGTEIFKLYDTYGFPMDLIAEACREQNIKLDETGFEAAIEEQRTAPEKPEASRTKPPGRPERRGGACGDHRFCRI